MGLVEVLHFNIIKQIDKNGRRKIRKKKLTVFLQHVLLCSLCCLLSLFILMFSGLWMSFNFDNISMNHENMISKFSEDYSEFLEGWPSRRSCL